MSSANAPDDLFFREIVQTYTGAPRFVRRDWLASDLDRHLDDSEGRFVLLVAEPGAGKSAFVAQLAGDHPDWLVYFIRRDQRTSLGGFSARSFLLRIGFQLAACYPELFALEQVRLEVEQRLGQVGDAVGVEVKRILASPFHQTVVRIRQEVERAQGAVTGLRVGEWVADPRLIEEEDLQAMALYDPARVLERLHPEKRITVLIDALDELRYHPEERDLLDWLTHCPPLPPNVRIVVTSRPMQDRLDTFLAKRQERIDRLKLAAEDRRVTGDLLTYATALVATLPATAAVAEPDRLASKMVQKADGNIGYLAALGRALDSAMAHREAQAQAVALAAIDTLPNDLEGLYSFFLGQLRSGPGRKDVKVVDPDSGRAGLMEAWSEVFHPILALLAISLEPLTLDQLHVLCGTLADRDQVIAALRWLDQFLDHVGAGYRLYHATVADFLLSEATRANPQSEGLFVDPVREHRRLAKVLEKDLQHLWEDSADDPEEQGRRVYARYHYLAHVALGKDWERLYKVVDEGAYGRGKLRFDRSASLYANDLDLVLRAVSRPGRDEAVWLADLPRLWRYKLLRSTVSSYAVELPSAAYQALSVVGREEEAADLARLIPDPGRRLRALAQMVPILAQRQETAERAASLLREAYEIASRFEEEKSREEHLMTLLDASRFLTNVAPSVPQPLRDIALPLARSLTDVVARAEALMSVADVLYRGGAKADVAAILDEVHALAGAASNAEDAQRLRALDRQAAVQYGGAEPEAVLGAPDSQGNPATAGPRSSPEPTGAEAGPLPPEARAERELELASVYLSRGEVDKARPLLQAALDLSKGTDDRSALVILASVASGLKQLGDDERADEAARRLREVALGTLSGSAEAPQGPARSLSLVAIEAARLLAEIGRTDLALEIASKLNPYERAGVLTAVVTALVRARSWDQSLEVVEEIRRARESSMGIFVSFVPRGSNGPAGDEDGALRVICEGLARDGQWDRAFEVFDRIQRPTTRHEALSHLALEKYTAGMRDGAAELVERLLREVRLGNTVEGREQGQVDAISLLLRAAQWSEARTAIQSLRSPEARAHSRASLVKALLARGELRDIRATIDEIEDPLARVQLLVEVAQKQFEVRSEGASSVDDLSPAALLTRAREQAREVTNQEWKAGALREIALTLARSGSAPGNLPNEVLIEAVEALNVAPRFAFVPTPWCDMAAAFATIGRWDVARRIASGLVNHDPFDGCTAFARLAEVASQNNDPTHAQQLLVEARTHAPRIAFPPQRASLLTQVAAAYGRLGLVDEALKNDEPLSPRDRAELLDRVAAELARAGRTDEARSVLAQSPEPEVSSYAREALVDAFIAKGDLNEARAAAGAIVEVRARLEKYRALAAALFHAGRSSEARQLISTALDELTNAPSIGGFWPAKWITGFMTQMIDLLVTNADDATALRTIEQQWLAAPGRREVLGRIPLVEPFAPRLSTVGRQVLEALTWVDETVLAF